MTTYTRNCPKCKTDIVYTDKYYFNECILKNRVCISCGKRGRIVSETTRLKLSNLHKGNKYRLGDKLSGETKQKMSLSHLGHSSYFPPDYRHSDECKLNQSISQQHRYKNEKNKKMTSYFTKKAMHRPEVRKRHIDALHHSKWIKVRTDKGQLELLEKWNRLGFKFEPNYQVHTDTDLFYVDGFDKDCGVVMEYDAKYHLKPYQQQKDLIRQQKIIDILNPKMFWRYDAVNKQWKNVLEKVG